ncbi:MAG: hypothetical protein VST72_00580 [Nitrospirota bacterium]|nr:hypothetical protein [Nitrospirota bacterium]
MMTEKILKVIIVCSGMVLMLILSADLSAARELMSGNSHAEEASDTEVASDSIISGEMNEYARDKIVVDDFEYKLCGDVKLFTKGGGGIPFKDIDVAERVILFFDRNAGCVRKIKAMRFAQ